MAKETYRNRLVNHSEKAGVKRIRLHDIRHSHASLLIDLNFSVLMISERLGHEDPSITLKTYAHLFPTKQNELVERLDEIFNK
jgi:integrase